MPFVSLRSLRSMVPPRTVPGPATALVPRPGPGVAELPEPPMTGVEQRLWKIRTGLGPPARHDARHVHGCPDPRGAPAPLQRGPSQGHGEPSRSSIETGATTCPQPSSLRSAVHRPPRLRGPRAASTARVAGRPRRRLVAHPRAVPSGPVRGQLLTQTSGAPYASRRSAHACRAPCPSTVPLPAIRPVAPVAQEGSRMFRHPHGGRAAQAQGAGPRGPATAQPRAIQGYTARLRRPSRGLCRHSAARGVYTPSDGRASRLRGPCLRGATEGTRP